MYLLKNALISISRNRGRNILIGIIILVIASSCAITLSIHEAASKLVTSYIDKYNIEATISMNRQNLMGNFEPGSDNFENNIQKFNEIGSISEEQIISYGTSSYVKDYYYTYNLSMNSSTLEKATEEIEANNEFLFGRGDHFEGVKNERMGQGDFIVLGYSSYQSMSDFISGKYTIVDGEVSENFTSNSCIINEELATLNDISVGDEITLVDPNNEDDTYTVTVTGIFSEKDSSNNEPMSMFSNSVNTIITNTHVISSIISNSEEIKTNLNPTFILTSRDVIDSFTEEVKEKGLSDFYQITTNLETIELGTTSIQNVSSFATTFLVLTLIIGGVVLFVLNLINIRERKYEIGVLRTIGMKKQYVIIQFVSELFIVSLVALLLGAGIGSISSLPVSNQLLKSEIDSSHLEQENIEQNFRGDKFSMDNKPGKGENPFSNMNGVMKLEEITSINAIVDFEVLIKLLGIGILLTLISSISATVAISRFSPITILKERS